MNPEEFYNLNKESYCSNFSLYIKGEFENIYDELLYELMDTYIYINKTLYIETKTIPDWLDHVIKKWKKKSKERKVIYVKFGEVIPESKIVVFDPNKVFDFLRDLQIVEIKPPVTYRYTNTYLVESQEMFYHQCKCKDCESDKRIADLIDNNKLEGINEKDMKELVNFLNGMARYKSEVRHSHINNFYCRNGAPLEDRKCISLMKTGVLRWTAIFLVYKEGDAIYIRCKKKSEIPKCISQLNIYRDMMILDLPIISTKKNVSMFYDGYLPDCKNTHNYYQKIRCYQIESPNKNDYEGFCFKNLEDLLSETDVSSMDIFLIELFRDYSDSQKTISF